MCFDLGRRKPENTEHTHSTMQKFIFLHSFKISCHDIYRFLTLLRNASSIVCIPIFPFQLSRNRVDLQRFHRGKG